MARRQITMRGRFLGANRPMDETEAHAVKVSVRASMMIGAAVAFAAYFTVLSHDHVLRSRVYGVFGVFVFVTVIAFLVFDVIICIDRRVRQRHERQLHAGMSDPVGPLRSGK